MLATLGKRVKMLRNKKGLTQPELAEKLEVSVPLIKYYESDTRTPSVEMLNKLCDFFGVCSDYLLCRSDIPEPNYMPRKAIIELDTDLFTEDELLFINTFLETYQQKVEKKHKV